ncbi:acylphosphatase [Candidatus Thioglobus sp.]|uniref:acylphosphatase n=1 Tax=Candidatus Thioglobus sp. TaxID=2026721 RepID=UPI003241D5F0
MKAITAIIHGKVQGVWFRGSTQKKANELGITGWIKNTSRGSVELEAHGEKIQLDVFIDWLSEGPMYSRVEQVNVNWIEPSVQFSAFSVKY